MSNPTITIQLPEVQSERLRRLIEEAKVESQRKLTTIGIPQEYPDATRVDVYVHILQNGVRFSWYQRIDGSWELVHQEPMWSLP